MRMHIRLGTGDAIVLSGALSAEGVFALGGLWVEARYLESAHVQEARDPFLYGVFQDMRRARERGENPQLWLPVTAVRFASVEDGG